MKQISFIVIVEYSDENNIMIYNFIKIHLSNLITFSDPGFHTNHNVVLVSIRFDVLRDTCAHVDGSVLWSVLLVLLLLLNYAPQYNL